MKRIYIVARAVIRIALCLGCACVDRSRSPAPTAGVSAPAVANECATCSGSQAPTLRETAVTLEDADGRQGDSAWMDLGPMQPAAAGSAPVIDAGPSSLAPVPELVAEPVDEASYLFDQTQLRTYNIVIAPSDLAMIDQNPMAEMYVPAGLEFE